MGNIDKNFVKKSFNTSAKTYDQHAGLQKETIGELLDLLDPDNFSVARTLDIGAGTGNLTSGLIKKFPNAKTHGCDLASLMLIQAQKKTGGKAFFSAADAEFLPYKDNSFELVVSSFTFQWLNNWERVINEIKRVLKPGGAFTFSFFGKKTFYELRQSYFKACMETGYSGGEALELSVTEEKVKTEIIQSGLPSPRTRTYCVIKEYQTVNDLLKAIRGMGAKNASSNRNRTLGVRKVWKKMTEIYEQDFGEQGSIPVTFEIIAGSTVK